MGKDVVTKGFGKLNPIASYVLYVALNSIAKTIETRRYPIESIGELIV